MEALAQLKLNIREKSSPYFSDEELLYLLEQCGGDVQRASYEALLRKAEDDSITLPSGMQIPNNRQYWLSLARMFRENAGRVLTR